MKDARRSYAQSWATVHFLRHHPRYKSCFEKRIDLLMSDVSVEEAVQGAFDGIPRAWMQTDFEAHLRSI